MPKGTGEGDSSLASNDLLWKVQFPDSSGGTDVMTYAYNAQGQKTYEKDQSGNVQKFDFDAAGRQTHRRVTTLASGFDGAVRRITTIYDDLGRVATTTQFDTTTVGNPDTSGVVDQVKNTYDGWGNLTNFEQDRNSLVGTGSDDYEVGYTYEKVAWSTSRHGNNTLRRTHQRLYHGSTERAVVQYDYGSGGFADLVSRVNQVKVGSTPVTVATYTYLGTDTVVGITYDEIPIKYDDPALDRFSRPTVSRWWKDNATNDSDIYNVTLAYDRDSNITRVEDLLQWDYWSFVYAYDNLNRLTSAARGQWNGSALYPPVARDEWTTLDQVGNWKRFKRYIDSNLDGDYADAGELELDDASTFDQANQTATRDTDSTAGTTANNYEPDFNAAGFLIDDDKRTPSSTYNVGYTYEYDAFGRLRKLKNQAGTVVEEFTYNGLGYRNGCYDGTWFYFAYDENWRMVATFRSSDTNAKELFVNHMAGANGLGSASQLDGVILRDRDANTSWTSATDGTREERLYLCQNWRGDVVALVAPSGYRMKQAVRYSAYGVPFGLPQGDVNGDGTVGGSDLFEYPYEGSYDSRMDMDLDGDIDINDWFTIDSNEGWSLGRGVLSAAPGGGSGGLGLRKGYAGYEHDALVSTFAHVRHRVLLTEQGRWTRRDPLEYVTDQMSLYQYCAARPVTLIDAHGLAPTGYESFGNPGSPVKFSGIDSTPIDEPIGRNEPACPGLPTCFPFCIGCSRTQSSCSPDFVLGFEPIGACPSPPLPPTSVDESLREAFICLQCPRDFRDDDCPPNDDCSADSFCDGPPELPSKADNRAYHFGLDPCRDRGVFGPVPNSGRYFRKPCGAACDDGFAPFPEPKSTTRTRVGTKPDLLFVSFNIGPCVYTKRARECRCALLRYEDSFPCLVAP